MNEKTLLHPGIRAILTKDRHNFEEVLQRFRSAQTIKIATFNISPEILTAVREVRDDADITIVTNIPNYWPSYYGKDIRDQARRSIQRYKELLNPKLFAAQLRAFFNFKNHAKIIIVDTFAYIGSANFSDKSKDNFECGFLVEGVSYTEQLNELFSVIQQQSIPYLGAYEDEATEISAIFSKLFEEFNNYAERIGALSQHETLTEKTAVLKNTFCALEGECSALYDLLSQIESSMLRDVVAKVNGRLESLADLISASITEGGKIYEYLNYDEDEQAEEWVGSSGAFEDDLEQAAQNASDFAAEKKDNLRSMAAKECERIIIPSLLSIATILNILISEVQEIAAHSRKIDNTSRTTI